MSCLQLTDHHRRAFRPTSQWRRTPQAHLNTEARHGRDLFNALVPVRAWMQDKQLRSWTTVLLLVLVAVPAYALSQTSLAPMAWIFAVYFAVAWLLLLYVIVRPEHIGGSRSLWSQGGAHRRVADYWAAGKGPGHQ